MPCEDGKMGNLYVKFNIEFPKNMESSCSKAIIDAIKANAEELSQ
jgi:DnaJ-class molecular chaperone